MKNFASSFKLAILAMLVISFSLLTGCGGDGSARHAVGVEVSPANPSIAKGTTQQFSAVLLYSDGSKGDATQTVTWTSSNTGIATINNTGLAQSLSVGSSTITASLGNFSANAQLTVTSAVITGLAITPASPSIANGTSQQFVATATFSDNSHQPVTSAVTWTSSDTTVASISNTAGSNGLAQSLKQGNSNISASYLGKSASSALTVTPAVIASVTVTPSAPSIAKGTTKQFSASAVFTDNTHQDVTASATWAVSDNTVASISNTSGTNGLAQGVGAGSVTITATYQSIPGSTTLTVTPAVLTSLAITHAHVTD